MDNWDEVRTAYHVARAGTVSGAADALGVHHATVIRHIDALETRIGVKLFQRHARGYAATEAGSDLLQVAQATDDQFNQLLGRLKGRGSSVTGELVVTSLAMLSRFLSPSLTRFQADHPGLIVRFLTDERVFRLEYGEAHVAIRAGGVPDEPDNVVQPFGRYDGALYASRDYVERRGCPADETEFEGHDFVILDNAESRVPAMRWMREHVAEHQFTYRCSTLPVIADAVRAGAGLGFIPVAEAADDPDLVEVLPSRPDWQAPLWLVTHVDLHRTAKVQTFLTFLKEEAKGWGIGL